MYQKYIPVEDASAYERVAVGVGRESLVPTVEGPAGHQMQRDWYTKAGLIPKVPDMKDVVDASFAGARAGRRTLGHRFLAPSWVELGSAEFKPGDTPETLVARAQGAAMRAAA